MAFNINNVPSSQIKKFVIPASAVSSALSGGCPLPLRIRGLNSGIGSGTGNYDLSGVFDKLNPTTIEDTFTGSNGDPLNDLLWETDNTTLESWWAIGWSSTASIQSNTAVVDVPTSSNRGTLLLRPTISGAFDIEIDASNVVNAGNFYMQAGTGPSDRVYLGRRGSTERWIVRKYTSGTGDTETVSTISSTSATIRITRDGSGNCTFYVGGSQIATRTGFTLDDLRLWFFIDYIDVTIDNFIINSGTIKWPVAPLRIAIADSSGVQKYVEVVSAQWDSANKDSLIYFDPSSLSSSEDNELFFYYDETQDENTAYVGESKSTPAEAVWPTSAKQILHMAQDPSGGADCIIDSTSNDNHMTPQGGMVSGDLVDGDYSGKALEFDGTSQYLQRAAITSINSEVTVVEFARVDDTAATKFLASQYHASNNSGWIFYTLADGTIKFDGRSKSGSGYFSSGATSGTYEGDSFHLFIGRKNVGLWEVLADGTSDTSSFDSSHTGDIGDASYLCIGAYRNETAAATLFLPGKIAESWIFDDSVSDSYIDVLYLAMRDGLITWTDGVANTAVLSAYFQLYDLQAAGIISVYLQKYSLNSPVISQFIQTYGLEIISRYIQRYGVADLITSVYYQPYTVANLIVKVFRQRYKCADSVVSDYSQKYDIIHSVISKLAQKYHISAGRVVSGYHQQYTIDDLHQIVSRYVQPYLLPPTGFEDQATIQVLRNGVEIQHSNLNLQWGHFSYAGAISFTMIDEVAWREINIFDPITVVFDGVSFEVIVLRKPNSESFETTDYKVEARSSSVLLDLPYSSELENDDLVSGTASEICEAIANTEGFSIVWDIPVNPTLTEDDHQISGQSPMQAIRGIVNGLGCIVQTRPDGSIYAQRKHPYNVNRYRTSPISATLYKGVDFTSVSRTKEEQPGYNRYFVSNETTSEGYTLETEQVSATHWIVKAYKVPWSTENVDLITSESTNVVIGKTVNPVEEMLTEDIEIFKGSGGPLSKPFYGLVSYNYRDAAYLGTPVISEAGDVSTADPGHSIISISYTTRYWRWDVYDTDIEKVQLLLVVGEGIR